MAVRFLGFFDAAHDFPGCFSAVLSISSHSPMPRVVRCPLSSEFQLFCMLFTEYAPFWRPVVSLTVFSLFASGFFLIPDCRSSALGPIPKDWSIFFFDELLQHLSLSLFSSFS